MNPDQKTAERFQTLQNSSHHGLHETKVSKSNVDTERYVECRFRKVYGSICQSEAVVV